MEPFVIDKQVHVFSSSYIDNKANRGPQTRSKKRRNEREAELLQNASSQEAEQPICLSEPELLIKRELLDIEQLDEIEALVPKNEPDMEGVTMDFEIGEIGVTKIEEEEEEESGTEEANREFKRRTPRLQKAGGFRGPYKCNFCHITQSSSIGLRAHILKHIPSPGKFQCSICKKTYTKCTTLNSHWIHHWKTKPYPCTNPDCKKSYATPKELRIHSITHTTDKPFECPICKQLFKRKTELSGHNLKRTDLKCNICEERFCLALYYGMHMKNHENETKQPKMHHCNICGETNLRKFRDKHMQVHFLDKLPYPCTLCQKKFANSNSLQLHMRYHTGEKPYECKICKKQFSQSSNLRTHERGVHQEHPNRKFQCSNCFLKLATENALKKHEILCGKEKEYAIEIHTPCEPGKIGTSSAKTSKITYQCKQCDQKFVRKEYLFDHLFRHHLKIKLFDCNYCDKKFTHRTELQTHLRYHTGESPFKCEVCSMTFKQSSHLKGHMVVHSDEKPHACFHCNKTFKTVTCLNGHIRLHTKELPYQCSLCPMAFPRSEVLKRHLNNHSGNRPFKCEYEDCEKAFISNSELKLHTMIHTDERPFPCDVCNHSFRTNVKLQEHFKSKRHISLMVKSKFQL